MSRLTAGLVIPIQGPKEALATIERAEARDVPAVWATVGGTMADATTLFAAAAVRTAHVGLGTSIVPTYPIHPAKLVSQVLVLADLASGRFRLGVGPSHRPMIEGAFGLPMGKPHGHLREYVAILRALLWEGRSTFKGEYYQVETALPAGVAPPRTPILVSALRSNAFHLAGEIADGAISWVCPVEYLVGTALPALRAGASAANRPTPRLIGHVPVALHPDRAVVRDIARKQFALYGRLPFYRGMFAHAGFPIGADNILPDALLDTLIVSGDAAAVGERLAAIQAAGVDELLVSHVPVRDAAAEEEALSAVLAP
jgi:alkanesulfonate monooxygenase SsuD/methylene tetrahydromethanopterin reductase-like flavin-dependent oxidoreductase (luciferase family)